MISSAVSRGFTAPETLMAPMLSVISPPRREQLRFPRPGSPFRPRWRKAGPVLGT